MSNEIMSRINSMPSRFSALNVVALICMALGPPLALSATLSVRVTDGSGSPLEDAVIYAEPVSGKMPSKSIHPVEIGQKNRAFFPLVTVVQTGTEIRFPNYDTVKHHVYSLSPAKIFDLPLYSGEAAKPQLFDKPGTVVLGCNIHDQMIAYVQVVNTPYFSKTDVSGKIKLVGVIPGRYVLKAWHYNLPLMAQVVEQPINIIDGDNNASFSLVVKRSKPAPEETKEYSY